MILKVCKGCGLEKPLENYGWSNKTKGYLRPKCKDCIAAYNKKYREDNQDYFYFKNKEYKKTHKEDLREKRLQDYWQDPEGHRNKRKEYYYENKERCLSSSKKWKDANKEYLDQYTAVYRAANPQIKRNSEAKRRASKKTQIREYVDKSILWKQDSRCWLCYKSLTLEKATMDHIIPLSKGGSHTYSNIKLACLSCNCKKQNKILEAGHYAN